MDKKAYLSNKKGIKLTPSKYQEILDDLSGVSCDSESESDSDYDESFDIDHRYT